MTAQTLQAGTISFSGKEAKSILEILSGVASLTQVFPESPETIIAMDNDKQSLIKFNIPSQKKLKRFFQLGFLDLLTNKLKSYPVAKLEKFSDDYSNSLNKHYNLIQDPEFRQFVNDHKKLWEGKEPFILDVSSKNLLLLCSKVKASWTCTEFNSHTFVSGVINSFGFHIVADGNLIYIPNNVSWDQLIWSN